MKARKRIFNVGTFFDGRDDLLHDRAVHVEDGRITAITSQAETTCKRDDDVDIITEPNGLMMPGLINSHHHAYSALARGMPVTGPMKTFPEILASLWWKLDRVLDREAVQLSAAVTAIDAIRHGCTCIVDHHSSPMVVHTSLNDIAAAFRDLSMSAVLCFETSDRNGDDVFRASVEENLSFADQHKTEAFIRGLFGLHASFTLCDESLRFIAEKKPQDLPVHVHVAEDITDAEHARQLGYNGALDRLDRFGLLSPGSLIVHGVHLTPDESALIGERELCLVHNPQSNNNNRVGYGDLDRVGSDRLLLGTDGMNSDMLSSAQAAYLLYCAQGGKGRDACELLYQMLFKNPAAYLSHVFGRPTGCLTEGGIADFAVFDYRSPTPISSANIMGHILYGLPHNSRAKWVYANGNPALENDQIIALDEAGLLKAVREKAAFTWNAYRSDSSSH